LFSFVDDIIFDPFAGSGSTLIEAINNKRYALGLEIDSNYIKNSFARIEKECSLGSFEISCSKILESENKHAAKEHN